MASRILHDGVAETTITSGLTAAATTITVFGGSGAEFPNPTGDEYFFAALVDDSGNREVVRVTARSVDSMTVVRGQDGTTARSWLSGDVIYAVMADEMVDNFLTKDEAQAGVPNYLGTTTGTDVITAGATPALISAPQAGARFSFTAGGTNTGSASLNIDGQGADTIRTQDGSALSGGEIVSGQVYDVIHDGTDLIIISGGNAFGDAAFGGTVTFDSASTATFDGTVNFVGADIDILPQGTSLLFAQAATPTGFTQNVTWNDRLLRVLSTAGANVGGNWAITGLNTSMINHTHSDGNLSVNIPNIATGDNNTNAESGDSGNKAVTGNTGNPNNLGNMSVSHNSANWKPPWLGVIVGDRDAAT
jgi:hypothetical protein